MSGLRARRHAETKRAIVDAAFELFKRHGFNDTMMDHIAEHAGVSRSTLYRRYANKEDIVLEIPRQWLVAWDSAVTELSDDTALDEAVAAGCLAVAADIDGSARRVLAAYKALSESPTLQSSGTASREWIERFITLINQHEPDLSSSTAMTIAGAYMGAIDAMMFEWSTGGGKSTVVDLTHQLLERLAPILR